MNFSATTDSSLSKLIDLPLEELSDSSECKLGHFTQPLVDPGLQIYWLQSALQVEKVITAFI